MYVTDWELSHVTSIAFDLGQMLGDLFETWHFKGIEAAVWLIESFKEGYGNLDDDLTFRTALQVGAHLICWCSRAPLRGTPEQVEDALRIGRDFVIHAHEKDRSFFDGTVLKCLFV